MTEDLDKIISEEWDNTLENHVHPRVKKPIVRTKKVQTAMFDFSQRQTYLNPAFVAKLDATGLDPRTIVAGLFDHELGHYTVHPMNLAHNLILHEAAHSYYPEESKSFRRNLVNFFSDGAVNLRRMALERTGTPLRETISATVQISDGKVFPLLSGLYDKKISFYNSPFFASEEYISKKAFYDEKLETLDKVDFWAKGIEAPYLKMFGDTIIDLMREERTREKGAGSSDGGSDCDGDANGHDDCDMCGGVGDPSEASDRELEDALNEIATERGLNEYERIKRFVQQQLGRNIGNKNDGKEKNRIAGLETADITWNDHLIDFYLRKSRGTGVYIFKRPLMVNETESYPEDNRRYVIGDPHYKIKVFSTPWVLPGITQRDEDVPGIVPNKKHTYPDLWLSIDSSGSMTHPSSMSYAVLFGFLLANTYYANNAKVGVMNFSADSAVLAPIRELHDVHRMLCAYYGGGTVFDVERLRQIFSLMSRTDLKSRGLRGFNISSKQDYGRIIASLNPYEREQVEKKEITIQLKKERELYEKLDHILVTDGGIYNLPEVINHFNSTARYTRNVIVVVHNTGFANEAKNMGLLNTQIISVDTEKDLLDVAIGQAKKLGER